MSLFSVWLETQGDGLVRADQVVGIEAHQTPALMGKPARWLLDVVLASAVGSGQQGEWGLNVLHRTLMQTPESPGDAPAVLARLLAQLDATSAAGVIKVRRHGTSEGAGADDIEVGSSVVRFRFEPFTSPPPGHHTGAEYL